MKRRNEKLFPLLEPTKLSGWDLYSAYIKTSLLDGACDDPGCDGRCSVSGETHEKFSKALVALGRAMRKFIILSKLYDDEQCASGPLTDFSRARSEINQIVDWVTEELQADNFSSARNELSQMFGWDAPAIREGGRHYEPS